MSALSVLSLFLVISSGLARPEKPHIEPQKLGMIAETGQENEPEYLDMLLATGQYELFAKVMNIPSVDFVRPNENARNENPMHNKKLEFGDIMPFPGDLNEESRQGYNFNFTTRFQWPDRYIPYAISSQYSQSEKATIEDGIKHWNRKVKCLKLRPRRGEKEYVYVHSGVGCWSYKGNNKNGTQQGLSLDTDGCLDRSTVLHEFQHAAGFTHEHNRLDRNKYVEVLWKNIPEELHHEYNISTLPLYGVQRHYDYYSIMHYPMEVEGKDAFRIIQDGIDSSRLGTGDDFTQTDIDKINDLYC